MLRVTRSQLQRYGIAILAAAQALFLKLLLVPQIEAENSFLLFFVAIVVSAGYGGFGPGLLAIVFSVLASAYFLIPPANSWNLNWDEILWLVVFVLLGLLISVVAAAHRQAEEVLKGQARQQAAVAQLGQRALCGTDLAVLMAEAVTLVAQTLDLEYCKLLELLPEGNTFLLRAGVGWPQELIGQATIGAQTNSHAGYTLLSKEPVVVKDWRTEKRFNRPSLHQDHTVISGVSVIVDGQDPPFGVLGVYSTRRRDFIQDDIHFLQAIANVLAEAITRKRVEESLRESEERYRGLVELSPDTILVQSEGKIVFVNQTGATLLGAEDPQELIGKAVSDVVHPDYREIVSARMRQVFEEAKSVPFLEEKFLRLDGGSVEVEVAAIPFSYNRQRAAQAVVRNITDRKRAEVILRQTEERFRLLVEGVQVYAIFILDPDGHVASWNSGAERILGYPEVEILGQPFSRFFTPEDVQSGEPERELNQALTSGRAEDERWQVRKDGTRFWASGVVTLLQDGSMRGFSKVMRDVTERKQAESEREQLLEREQAARAQAEAANRMKDEFLATLSHELRTPLNAILGWARLLRTRKFNEDTTAGALETIERNAKSQAQLIEDLLDVSRITQGNLRLNLCACELIPVIEAAITAVRPTADAQGVQLNSRLDPTEPVMGDPSRLQQVVWNLLSNAIKFTPRGGRVEVKLKQLGSQVQIVVSDTGKGITADFLPYVFERFRQFDSTSTRPHGGLGLGLAIASQLVDLHGGTVHAESQGAGQGATFTVNLPLKTTHTDPDRSKVPAKGAFPWPLNGSQTDRGSLSVEVEALSGPALNGLRVLVVDDEADAREVLSTLLEQSGAKVTTVASVREALKVLKHFQMNLLVSDIGMPGEDGYALIHKLRASADPQNSGEQIPAIALTAYASEEDRRRALAAGFQMYLTKPVEPTDLVAMVKTLTGRDQV